MSAAPELRVALPRLADSVARLAVLGAAPRLPGADWLLARGRARAVGGGAWREWLLAGTGLQHGVLPEFPAGPCSLAGGVGDVAAGTWARAEPVHLLTALDHLQLAAPAPLPLDDAETAALLESLNAHLAGTGFRLSALADGGWLCACPDGLQCETPEPAAALGRSLRELLPTGRDATRLRSVVNELQMLLHEHPVNTRRAARGEPVVNSVWVWGIGTARAPSARVAGDLLTDDAWLAGLWRLHGGQVLPAQALAESLLGGAADLRVAVAQPVAAPRIADHLRMLDERLFGPARAALVAARWSRACVLAGGREFAVTPRARWAVWRRPRPLGEVLA